MVLDRLTILLTIKSVMNDILESMNMNELVTEIKGTVSACCNKVTESVKRIKKEIVKYMYENLRVVYKNEIVICFNEDGRLYVNKELIAKIVWKFVASILMDILTIICKTLNKALLVKSCLI